MQEKEVFQKACRLLAKCCGLDAGLIETVVIGLANSPDDFYTRIRKRKKSGALRIIHAPSDDLKAIQMALVPFFYRWPTSARMYGFQPQRSPADNARYHITVYDRRNPTKIYGLKLPRWTLTVDLKDAFPSVTSNLLRGLYRQILVMAKLIGWQGLDQSDAELVYEEFIKLLLLLTTYQGRLPQGAPSSPYLLNLALCYCGVVDRIETLCTERKKPFRFSIYADDITVSSGKEKITDGFIYKLKAAIEEGGWFKVNLRKVNRNSSRYKAHKITGVVLTLGRVRILSGRRIVVGPKLTLPQKTLKSLRGQIHSLRMILERGDKDLDFDRFNRVMGKIAWVKMVYRGSGYPPSIRGEILAFEEAWKKRREEHLREYYEQMKALEIFLRFLMSRNN